MSPARSKMLVYQPRRPDLTHDEFSEHWRTVHAEHARRITALQKYVQSHRATETTTYFPDHATEPSIYDGVSEAWFASAESLAGMTSSVEYRDGALVDEPNFLDIPRKVRLLCAERIMYAAPGCEDAALAKVIISLAGGARETLQDLLLGEQATLSAMVADVPGLARYTVCAVEQMLADEASTPIHFVLELGWRSLKDLGHSFEATGMSRLLEAVSQPASSSTALVAQEFRFI